MSELSRTAGLPPATVKWYLRIGLLHRGTPTAVNQASYDDTHVRRLRLVRALLEVGGLSVDWVKRLVDAIDDPDCSLGQLLEVAHQAVSAATGHPDSSADLTAVDEFLSEKGWQIGPESPARHDLAMVLSVLRGLGPGAAPAVQTQQDVARLLEPYAAAVEPLARQEVANTSADLPRDQVVERVVVGTVLMERALGALRRLAQEHFSRLRDQANILRPEKIPG